MGIRHLRSASMVVEVISGLAKKPTISGRISALHYENGETEKLNLMYIGDVLRDKTILALEKTW